MIREMKDVEINLRYSTCSSDYPQGGKRKLYPDKRTVNKKLENSGSFYCKLKPILQESRAT